MLVSTPFLILPLPIVLVVDVGGDDPAVHEVWKGVLLAEDGLKLQMCQVGILHQEDSLVVDPSLDGSEFIETIEVAEAEFDLAVEDWLCSIVDGFAGQE